MSYVIDFKIWDDFLKVELTGTYPLEKFNKITRDIDEVIDANNITKVMIDLRGFKGRFGVFDGIHHIEKFRTESKFIQFAILDVPENKTNNDFFENASFNRGYKVMFFYAEEEAKKWLMVDLDTEPKLILVKEY